MPPDLVRKRVLNELALVRKELKEVQVVDEALDAFPLRFTVRLRNAPGPEWKEGQVVDRTEHELLIAVHEGYPEQKPVVRWRTPIFHPNVMPPAEGGYVCTALLDRWSFRSTLKDFLLAVEVLLATPNPDSPYDTDTCTRAAQEFRKRPYRPQGVARAPPRDDLPRVRPGGDRPA